MRARQAGRPREALEILSEYLSVEPDAYEAAIASWEVAASSVATLKITSSLLRMIRIELKRALSAAAIDHWLVLVADGIPEKVDPSLLIHMALLLREQDHQSEAVHALRCALERSEDRQNHVIAARIARAARGLDPGVTETAAWRALGSIELTLPERQALEGLIAEVLETGGGRGPVRTKRSAPASSAERNRCRSARPSPPHRPPLAAGVRPRSRSTPTIACSTPSSRCRSSSATTGRDPDDKRQKKLGATSGSKRWPLPRCTGSDEAGDPGGSRAELSNASEGTLRVIRIRGDQFDPRRLFSNQRPAVDALRSFVKIILERSEGTALPDADTALGRPFASFDEAGDLPAAIRCGGSGADVRADRRSRSQRVSPRPELRLDRLDLALPAVLAHPRRVRHHGRSEAQDLRLECRQVEHADAVVPRQVTGAFARVEAERAAAALERVAVVVPIERDVEAGEVERVELARVVHHGDPPTVPLDAQRRVDEHVTVLRARGAEQLALDVIVAEHAE